MIPRLLIVTLIAGIGGIGAARDTIPAATPIGKAQSCIPRHAIRQSHVRSDRIIDFELAGGRVYRNTLPHDCPDLGFQERFSFSTSIDELCSTDIITVLEITPLHAGASCGLGEFQPVTLASTRARRE